MDLAAIGPAGSVNSNVLDMAQWVRLQLGQGAIDGKQLISATSLNETWTPQIEIGGGVSYGLGWMLREHAGRRVVEHGGNIDGFTAEVALMPEENLGYVLLMNLDVAPLRVPSVALVFDALLEQPTQQPVAVEAAAIDFDDFVGTYIANFATFRDERFKVLVNGDKLALDIPSQQQLDLEAPDADGKWYPVITDQIAITFARNDAGEIVSLTIHQGPYHFEVPREGVEVEPEVPLEELEKYTGTFVREEGGKQVKILISASWLAIEDKGKLLPFTAPDANGKVALRARADQGATFQVDAEGEVDSFVFHGDAGDKLFTRLATEPAGDLPTVAELLALRDTDARAAAVRANSGTKVTGEVWVAQSGIRGSLTHYTRGEDRFANLMDFGKFGRIEVVANGQEAWRYTSMRGFDVLKGDDLKQALLEHPAAVEGDWREHFNSIDVVRSEDVEGRATVVVELAKEGLPNRTYWVDAETGDVLRAKLIVLERSIRIPVTITYHDFAEVDGIRQPSRVEIANPATGRTVLTFTDSESGLELGDDVFTLVDPDAEK